MSTSAPSASTITGSTPTDSPNFYGPSISKGAAAGIGIGISLSMFIIIVAAVLYCHRKIQGASEKKDEKNGKFTTENETPSDNDKKIGDYYKSELPADVKTERLLSQSEMAAEESRAVEEYCQGVPASGKENLPPNVGQSVVPNVGVGSDVTPGEFAVDVPTTVPRSPASRTHFEHTVRALVTEGRLSAPNSGVGFAAAPGQLNADPLRSNAVYELDATSYKPYSPSRITTSHYGPTPSPTGDSRVPRD